jgi:hypothetical protein
MLSPGNLFKLSSSRRSQKNLPFYKHLKYLPKYIGIRYQANLSLYNNKPNNFVDLRLDFRGLFFILALLKINQHSHLPRTLSSHRRSSCHYLFLMMKNHILMLMMNYYLEWSENLLQ